MEFLLELLTEEMPSSHIKTALEQLEKGFREELGSARIAVHELKSFGTPRRLILAADIAEGEEERETVVTGPPRSAGLDPQGGLSRAGQGFARAHNVAESDIEVISTSKGEYLGFRRRTKGRAAGDVLAEAVPRVLGSLTFPKTMRWGESQLRFSRPVHGLLCIIRGKPVAASFAGLSASNRTVGHRVIAPGPFEVGSFAEYRDKLAAAGVIIDQTERQSLILKQADEHLSPRGARIYPDPGLLEELSWTVEHPFVIFGSFPEKYLNLPIEVLAAAMREGQKLFTVVRDRKQLPHFIGVADVAGDPRGLIRAGNERVLRARLEDAEFFWAQDQKLTLSKRSAGLKHVVFQERLGTYEDKTQRLQKLAAYICDRVGASPLKKDLMLAAGLCKADLLSDMVREFPGLQGRMGGLYARQEGYPAGVWQSIYEHYKPASLEDNSPASLAGAVLSLADKLDSTVGVIGVGVEFSGSSDPFGLRRNAHGVIKVILDHKLRLSFPRLSEKAVAVYADKLTLEKEETLKAVREFFEGRMRFALSSLGYRYDIVAAALGPGLDSVYDAYLRVKALDALKSSPQFEPFILMAKRVKNILRGQPRCRLVPETLVEKEERELHAAFSIIRNNAAEMIKRGDFVQAQNMAFKLRPVLNAFFDKVLVIAEDRKLRQNRLGLLQAIDGLLGSIADYSQVVVEGERQQARS